MALPSRAGLVDVVHAPAPVDAQEVLLDALAAVVLLHRGDEHRLEPQPKGRLEFWACTILEGPTRTTQLSTSFE